MAIGGLLMGSLLIIVAYLGPYLLVPVIVGGAAVGGVGFWAGPWTTHVLLPMCDEGWHRLRRRSRGAEPNLRGGPRVARAVPLLYVPVQLGLLIWAAGTAAREGLALWQWIGLVLGTGVATGAVGITYAHELIHRTSALERRVGEVLLMMVAYMPFAIEHVEGHHAMLATAEDPATAPRGMSLYRFIPRAALRTARDAWAIEVHRLARLREPVWGLRNRMLWYAGLPIAFGTLMARLWGLPGLLLFVGQAAVATGILETVNYLQHYGLRRARTSEGGYERLGAHHSWDCDRELSGALLLNLPRHSDHHLRASRRWTDLKMSARAPLLPAGYPVMMLLALVPPVFFAVMHPRLDALGGSERTPR